MPFEFSTEDLDAAVLMSGCKNKATLEGWRVHGKLTGFVYLLFFFWKLEWIEQSSSKIELLFYYLGFKDEIVF